MSKLDKKFTAIIVMGVSGCGKSTVGRLLADRLGWPFIESDDYHSADDIQKMANGIPLTDEDRWPWLDRVATALLQPDPSLGKAGCVVACSALRRAYRDRLRQQVPGLHFVFLEGEAELLAQRMAQREGHFMLLQLLSSQLATLEIPGPDEHDVLTLPAQRTLEQLVQDVCDALARAPADSPTGQT